MRIALAVQQSARSLSNGEIQLRRCACDYEELFEETPENGGHDALGRRDGLSQT